MRRRDTEQRAQRLRAYHNERAGEGWFELSYDKNRLQTIQDSLRRFDVDFESLIGEVRKIAFTFDGFPFWKYLSTPLEVASDVRETVTIIEALLTNLDRSKNNYIDPISARDNVWPEMLFPPLEALPIARLALASLRDELQRRVDKLMTMKGGDRNASKAHREYWALLTRLWWKATAHKANQRQHKHLIEFLIACSEPVFPRETTKPSVTAFVVEEWPSLQTVTSKR